MELVLLVALLKLQPHKCLQKAHTGKNKVNKRLDDGTELVAWVDFTLFCPVCEDLVNKDAIQCVGCGAEEGKYPVSHSDCIPPGDWACLRIRVKEQKVYDSLSCSYSSPVAQS